MRYCPSSIGRKYCNVIALGKLALTDVQAAGLNSQIISTGPVTSRMNTADYLIAVTDSADPALTASASTYSGNVTVYNRNGNAVELTDASTFDGDITAYSEKGSAFRLSGSEACVWFKTEADKGWYVKSVKLNGSEITPDNDGKYRFIMTRDSELVVEAEQRKYTLTVTSGENGTVTPGSGEFISGTEVTLTVAPDEGYQVKSVTLNGSAVELTNGKYTFALTENSVFAA